MEKLSFLYLLGLVLLLFGIGYSIEKVDSNLIISFERSYSFVLGGIFFLLVTVLMRKLLND